MKFRSERERLIVVWGSIIGCLLLWWTFFLQPSLRQIGEYEQKTLPATRANLQRAREIAGQLNALKSAPPKGPVGSIAMALEAIVRQQIKVPADHVKNLQNVGNGAQIKLSDMDGGTVMRLLHALEAASIRPDSAEFRDISGKKLWDVTITVSGPPGGAPGAPPGAP